MYEVWEEKFKKGFKMKLSILICAVPSRSDNYFTKLLDVLLAQDVSGVEILWLGDNKKRSVGEKRNNLLDIANGEYVTFIDDDDMVANDYVSELLRAIKGGADVINFQVMCSVNGGEYKRVDYDATFKRDSDHADHYKRIPNHLMCTKRVLAQTARFPEISMSEDAQYAKKLMLLIKSQTFINKPLYYYTFSHQISETQ